MMKLRPQDIAKLEQFLERVAQETYPEPPSELHTKITRDMFAQMVAQLPLPPDAEILDIGCGQGLALELFQEKGLRATGITLNDEDMRVCQAKGFKVLKMDQSFLDFPAEAFDCVWCRHCLEHSIFPYFTLNEINRVLRPQGLLYLEMPSPETACRHESNKNHYSVLGKRMWLELLKRSGFQLVNALDINFQTRLGPDTYWVFMSRKQ